VPGNSVVTAPWRATELATAGIQRITFSTVRALLLRLVKTLRDLCVQTLLYNSACFLPGDRHFQFRRDSVGCYGCRL
jgi:hypothetical protein